MNKKILASLVIFAVVTLLFGVPGLIFIPLGVLVFIALFGFTTKLTGVIATAGHYWAAGLSVAIFFGALAALNSGQRQETLQLPFKLVDDYAEIELGGLGTDFGTTKVRGERLTESLSSYLPAGIASVKLEVTRLFGCAKSRGSVLEIAEIKVKEQ